MAFLTKTSYSFNNAAPFSLLATNAIGYTTVTATVTTNGDVGTTSIIDSGLTITINPPGSIVTGITVVDAISDADTMHGQGLSLSIDHFYTTAVTLESISPVTPGVYKFSQTETFAPLTFTGTLTFNGNGVYVFIIEGDFLVSPSATMNLTDGASACDIFWLTTPNDVGQSAVEIDTFANFDGNIIAAGANGIVNIFNSVTYTGRVIAFGSISPEASPPNQSITFSATGSGTLITLNAECVCFGKGTQIKTIDGYKSIESLNIGDSVLTYGSIVNSNNINKNMKQIKKIKWIGHYTDEHFTKNTYPVCFKKNSLGFNVPFEDLYMSPLHLIETKEGKVTCARNLINGSNIIWAKNLSSIDYYHIEVDDHCVISANGLKAETLLGENNKFKFKI